MMSKYIPLINTDEIAFPCLNSDAGLTAYACKMRSRYIYTVNVTIWVCCYNGTENLMTTSIFNQVNILSFNQINIGLIVGNYLCHLSVPRGQVILWCSSFNSFWPTDNIWREVSGSTLAQVTVCCLPAIRHYLKQCWRSRRQWVQHCYKPRCFVHWRQI